MINSSNSLPLCAPAPECHVELYYTIPIYYKVRMLHFPSISTHPEELPNVLSLAALKACY